MIQNIFQHTDFSEDIDLEYDPQNTDFAEEND